MPPPSSVAVLPEIVELSIRVLLLPMTFAVAVFTWLGVITLAGTLATLSLPWLANATNRLLHSKESPHR